MLTYEPFERFSPKQRHVARQQHHRPAGAFEMGLRLQERVTRAELRLLQCKAQARPFRKRRFDAIGEMADDEHRRRGTECVGCP